jgi:hypothetical protein
MLTGDGGMIVPVGGWKGLVVDRHGGVSREPRCPEAGSGPAEVARAGREDDLAGRWGFPQRRPRRLPGARWPARPPVIMIIAACAAMSSCASPHGAGPAGRYVGTMPDRCPFVSASQVAEVTGHDVTAVQPQREPDAQGAQGCSYDFSSAAGQSQYIVFSYFRGIGEPGFEHWANDGQMVQGPWVQAIWGSATLTVLTSKRDVVSIYMFTDSGDLAQAEQIFRLAAPRLR